MREGDLAERFRRIIRLYGPMPLSRYMGEANARYYASRDPLGAPKRTGGGDFVTAPEISQMFGELAGLWLADLWDRSGRPADAIYAELGPGRGTLARDALRAMATAGLRPRVHFVEGSPVLRDRQRQAVPDAVFHQDAASLPDDRPLLIVANEFLDALPIRQLVRTEHGWRERMVALSGDSFVFVTGPQPMDDAVPQGFAEAPQGTILETSPGVAAVVDHIAQRLAAQGGGALVFDYGGLAPRTGSTFQAVSAHRKVDVLDAPGTADLTAHVDFAMLGEIARRRGLRVQAATQGDWLTQMGIGARAAALSRHAPEQADAIEAARARLVHEDAMGELFKVMAMTAPGWPGGAAFEGRNH